MTEGSVKEITSLRINLQQVFGILVDTSVVAIELYVFRCPNHGWEFMPFCQEYHEPKNDGRFFKVFVPGIKVSQEEVEKKMAQLVKEWLGGKKEGG